MKKNYFMLLAMLAAVFCLSFMACDEEEGGGNVDPPPTPVNPEPEKPEEPKEYIDYIDLARDAGIVKWEFETSPLSTLLYHLEMDNGDHFIVDARKDENGIPTSLLSLVIKTGGDNPELSRFLCDELSRPVDVTAPNGIRILYEWLTDTKAAVTFIDPETNDQLNTVYDFLEGNEEQMPPAPKVQTKRQGDAVLTVKPINKVDKPVVAKAKSYNVNGRKGKIYLKTCGKDDMGQDCWVMVYDKGTAGGGFWSEWMGYRGRYDATWVQDGYFEYMLPDIDNKPAIAEFLAKAGPEIKWYVDRACLPNMSGNVKLDPMTMQMVTSVCIAIAAKCAITGPLAVKIGAACTALGSALLVYCNTLNKALVSNDPNSPSVQDLPVVKDLLDATFGKMWEKFVVVPATYGLPLDVYVCVNALPKYTMTYGYTTGSASSEPLPVVEISTVLEPKIESFKLEPPAPSAHQGYVAIASLSCIPEGSVAVMTVVGTDGYQNTKTEKLGNEVGYSMTLSVPGAATAGVKDLCTIAVELPDGTLLQKQASLVFQ